jgi:predicted Rossmann fold flavoprotein
MTKLNYDVAVIGGGPAGMMAAGRAAELGAKVVLIEKNAKLGKKLLITGGGRCNITNAELDVRKMVQKYGPKGKALFGSFTRFGVEETLAFFNSRGLPTKIEAEKRVFPISNKAEDVWKIMVDYINQGKVQIINNTKVLGLKQKDALISGIKTHKGLIVANNYIIATGGKSRPETGSTGEGFDWLRTLGHLVEEPDSALVPVKIKEQWVKDLSGQSFAHAGLTVFQDGKKQESRAGKILLTHFGLSGPLVLNMSKNIAELFKYGAVNLQLDLYPDLDTPELDKKVLGSLNQFLNKKIRNSLGEIVPPKLISALLTMAEIDPEKPVNALAKTERLRLVKLIKTLPMTVSGFLGLEKAIVTSGGVSLKEIDFKTMQSKLFSNLYLAGDILNFDRPSGGFSLQICWTTGFLAGENSVTQLT